MEETTLKSAADSLLADGIANESNDNNDEDVHSLNDSLDLHSNLDSNVNTEGSGVGGGSSLAAAENDEDLALVNNEEDALENISVGTFDESSQASQPQEDNNNQTEDYSNEHETANENENENQVEDNGFESVEGRHEDSIGDMQNEIIEYQDSVEDEEEGEEQPEDSAKQHSSELNESGLDGENYTHDEADDEVQNTELEEVNNENADNSNEVIENSEGASHKSAHHQQDEDLSHEANENQENFEEVDANLSTHSAHESMSEDNMLGEADNTLLIQKSSEELEKSNDDQDQQLNTDGGDGVDGTANDDTTSLMEVDDEDDDSLSQHDESKDDQETGNQQDEDVEMVSPVEELSNQEEPKDRESANIDKMIESLAESKAAKDTSERNDVDKDEVDTSMQSDDLSYNELEQIRKELSGNDEEQNDQQSPEDNDNDNGEPVENVQEPEESDVCLIPDDEDKEVTDAEKEQAILAREEAEKDDDESMDNVDKDSESKEAEEQPNFRTKHKDRSASPGGDSTANNTSNDQNELPDPDEPLLEEMHPSSVGDAALAKVIISWTVTSKRKCKQCNRNKLCSFRCRNLENPESFDYVCDMTCCESLMSSNPGKYFIRRKKFLLDEIGDEVGISVAKTTAKKQTCIQCKEVKFCKYFFKQDDETFYLCNDKCYNALNSDEPDKYKLKRHSIRVRNIGATTISSMQDTSPTNTKSNASSPSSVSTTTASQTSSKGKGSSAESRVVARTAAEAEAAKLERISSFRRKCAECYQEVVIGDKNLLWETMDFCNEICLGKYQRTIGASCQTCSGEVPHQALGKYCVRFGFDIQQFCCASCLNEFKKGLKTCSCCQKDISSGNEGFLAPVGDKEQFKDFCSQACMRRYDAMCNPKKKLRNDICAVCNIMKPVRTEIILDGKEQTFCSNPCFSAFKFVSNIVADQCGMCAKYFERKGDESFTIYNEHRVKVFCTRICLNVYIIVNRRIVSCQWCKVKKYNFDMIYKKQDNQEILMCSLNCLTLYGVSLNAFSRTSTNCDNCQKLSTPQYHLTMSDASMRNFCTYQCVMQFQSQFARAPLTLDSEGNPTNVGGVTQHKVSTVASGTNSRNSAPFPTGLPKRIKLKHQQAAASPQNAQAAAAAAKQTPNPKMKMAAGKAAAAASAKKVPNMPVISAVSSLASGDTGTMISNSVSVRRSTVRMRKMDISPPPSPSLTATSSQSNSSQGIGTGGRGGRSRKTMPDYRQRSPSPVAQNSNVPPPTLRGRVRKSIPDYRQDTPSPPIPTNTPPPSLRSTVSSTTSKRSSATSPGPGAPGKDGATKIIMVPPMPAPVKNMATSCKPATVEVGFQIEPKAVDACTQTNKDYSNKVLIPVPVPIFIPQPMCMYSLPFPVPVPFPLPIPVPIFVPTTRNSAEGILKEIKKIQDKMPTDPLEAELLMMAEMVADDKGESDSGSEDEIKPDPGVVSITYTNDHHHLTPHAQVEVTNHGYGEDMLQMALKMATGEYDQTSEDLESAMTANTIQNPPPGMVVPHDEALHIDVHGNIQQTQLMRKRNAIMSPVALDNRSPAKRQRLLEMDQMSANQALLRGMKPVMAKPDTNMCLKFTFGVNAWKQWVVTKNADIEKSSVKRRPFKTELLQMTADELNYSLCLFVKEVRKPNGSEYAPDTIYYLVLGIQQYLYENGRIDNIFTDTYYERFTDCLDEVARRFSILYNDSQYIVTRVEEEHLWECKQLGAHSPHVLLSTLMFFNTKHFNLTTVEEHMQLSFSHIMKHWKRTSQTAKVQGTRNVLLRFYPPQAGLDANPRKKKVYEQQENEENPLRCPVRLYEFYLSKCPESVKTRNDVFYLQPERSCVPDSPVWYSTQALSRESLEKMLHRVKMVKEINIALLTS